MDDDRPISVVLAEASVAVLVEMLGDADDRVRESIVVALGTKRNPDAAPRLIETLLQDPVGEIRARAATALGKIGAPSSIPALGQAVRDPDGLVAYEAVLALKAFSGEAMGELIQALEQSDERVRRAAAVALQLTAEAPALVPLIHALGDTNVGVRRAVAEALARLKDPRTIPAFERALADPKAVVRAAAVGGLAAIDDAAVVPLLFNCWNDSDPRVHREVARALKARASDHDVPFVLAALSDLRPSHRASAAQILGTIADPSAIPSLLNALHDSDREVRDSVIHALGALAHYSSTLSLVPFLNDPDMHVATAAANALGQIGDAASIPGLVSALGAGDYVTRIAAADALGDIGDPAALPALVAALQDADGSVRAAAAAALGDIGEPVALDSLARLADDRNTAARPRTVYQHAPQVRDVANEAASRLRSSQAVRELRCSAYHPKEIVPSVWKPLHLYLFTLAAADLVAADARAQLGNAIEDYRHEDDRLELRGGDSFVMRATPRLDGFEFNPPSARIRFCEPWHRLDFRLRADEGRLHQASNGHVSITIGGAVVADIPISIYVGPDRRDTEIVAQTRPPYRSVFFSYSHRDLAVVKRVERACRALGMSYLRDAVSLKSGERWNEALLELIDQADVFQLFWSKHAAASPVVQQEWRHACGLGRGADRFIRPVYWSMPMPPPPSELEHLHFAYEPRI